MEGLSIKVCGNRKVINYFSIAFLKHHNWKQVIEERLSFGLCLQRDKHLSQQEDMAKLQA